MRASLPIIAALLAGGCVSTAPQTLAYEIEAPSDTVIIPSWAARGPSPADYHRVYPSSAKADGVEGIVYLRCNVELELTFACEIQEESPAGYGFGSAAMALAREFAIKPNYPQVTPGSVVRLPIRFVLES